MPPVSTRIGLPKSELVARTLEREIRDGRLLHGDQLDSEGGLMRWYARCCNTPIANTLPNPRRLPFIGVILPPGTQGFGPVTAQVNTAAARTPIRSHGFAAAAAALVGRALKARLTGQAGSELFDAEGAPIVTPHVLTREERDAARP